MKNFRPTLYTFSKKQSSNVTKKPEKEYNEKFTKSDPRVIMVDRLKVDITEDRLQVTSDK